MRQNPEAWTRRFVLSVCAALVVHLTVAFFAGKAQTRIVFEPAPETVISFVPMPAIPEPPEPEIIEEALPAEEVVESAEPREDPQPKIVPTVIVKKEEPEEKKSELPLDFMRIKPEPKKDDGQVGVLLRGSDGLPFAPNLKTMEGALSYKVDGPMSTKKEAEKRAKTMLAESFAEDSANLGIVDDYFRQLKDHVELSWRPSKNHLADKSKVSRAGLTKDMVSNPGKWGEFFKSSPYAQKEKDRMYKASNAPTKAGRLKKLREETREGNYTFSAIAEVRVTQAATGQILSIEFPLESGHPTLDEKIKDAFAQAVKVVGETPPARLAHGRPFQSNWQLRATWKMVPPTAFLSGAWDITPKGFKGDVPFTIQKSKGVKLQWVREL